MEEIINIGTKCTFNELISKYKVVIPKIQRDYVQGRENNLIKKNREEFVKELVDSLVNNQNMSLNFIYGTISNENEFIPIDGQQRLTTIFLLHLYLYARNANSDSIKVLKDSFSYETRYTTNRFLKSLSNNLISLLEHETNDVASAIRLSFWYVTPWDNDPNIHSCLAMLNTIHKYCQKKDCSNFVDRLNNITFMWLKLDKLFGNDNQLYIRMNSRGKQLTDFENFKAEIYEKILEKNAKSEDFKRKIDNEWYSFLWGILDKIFKEEYIEKRAALCDSLLKRIIHWTIISKASINEENELKKNKNKVENDDKNLYDYASASSLEDGSALSVDDYYSFAVKDNLENYLLEDVPALLDFLIEIEKNGVFEYIEKDVLDIDENYNYKIDEYSSRVLLFSINKFANINRSSDSDKIDSFKLWYRVILNLVSNKEIDSPSDFQKCVKAIDKFENDIRDWLGKDELKKAFRPSQIEEEIIKLDLIKNGDWKNEIVKSENTSFDNYQKRNYFKGQIGFLLHMSRKNDYYDIEKFKYYRDAIMKVFDKENYFKNSNQDDLKRNISNYQELMDDKTKECSFDNLFHRALLTKGNYWIDFKNKIKTFFVYSERHNNYDFLGAFRSNNENKYLTAVECLKKLLDDYHIIYGSDKFDFEEFYRWLPKYLDDYIKNIDAVSNSKEDKLINLLISNQNLFKYIHKNYYVYFDNEKCDLMRFKIKKKGGFINITDLIKDD